MTLAERLAEATQKFNNLDKQREVCLKEADECLAEMNRFQGEYRILQELEVEEALTPQPLEDTAVPAGLHHEQQEEQN